MQHSEPDTIGRLEVKAEGGKAEPDQVSGGKRGGQRDSAYLSAHHTHACGTDVHCRVHEGYTLCAVCVEAQTHEYVCASSAYVGAICGSTFSKLKMSGLTDETCVPCTCARAHTGRKEGNSWYGRAFLFLVTLHRQKSALF